MPNGFHGSEQEWQRIEAPLKMLDSELQDYTRRYGMSFSHNYHDWPERSLVWGAPIRKLMQIYLEEGGDI
jgi:hypothetical protein